MRTVYIALLHGHKYKLLYSMQGTLIIMVVQYEECGMWRIIYSKYKLTETELEIIKSILDNYSYTCGSSMADLNLCGKLSTVCIRIVRCHEFITILSATNFFAVASI